MKKIYSGAILLVILALANPLDARGGETVLFDEGHGQRFLAGQGGDLDLSGLSAVFREEGLLVKTSKRGITDETLAGVEGLVISGPFRPFTPAEIEAISRFVEKGGRLCVMLHIGSPAADLLHRLQVSVSTGVIHEQENIIGDNNLDFHVTELKPHALTRGLKRFSVFGGWGLLTSGDNGEIIGKTSGKAWMDLNRNSILDPSDAVFSFGLLVAGKLGEGQFAVFGDDAIFQNRFLSEDNALLAKNLAGWLKRQ